MELYEDLKGLLSEEARQKMNESNTSIIDVNIPMIDNELNYKKDLVTYYLTGIGGMTICVLGLIGNILSLIVLSRKSMRSSTYSYLSALSFCDSLVLIFTVFLIVKDLEKPVKGERFVVNDINSKIFLVAHPLAITFQVISIWLTLAFTVDRYIMICHPFTAEPYCTITRARIVIFCIFILGLLFNIPKFLEYTTVTVILGDRESTVNELTMLGRSPIFKQLYHSVFYIAFVCGLPFITLAVLNAFLMHAVRLSRRRGREINAADKKRNDTTVMLIGVVVVFFICQMPALVSRTMWAVMDNNSSLSYSIYSEICNFLIVLNSAINIVPYYFFGKKFRREFWLMICQCLPNSVHFTSMTRSFSLTQLDPNATHSPNSRNHSVVSAHLIRNDGYNNGNLTTTLVTGDMFKSCDKSNGKGGVKNTQSNGHSNCLLLNDNKKMLL